MHSVIGFGFLRIVLVKICHSRIKNYMYIYIVVITMMFATRELLIVNVKWVPVLYMCQHINWYLFTTLHW